MSWITKSTEQNPSLQTDSRSASQEASSFL